MRGSLRALVVVVVAWGLQTNQSTALDTTRSLRQFQHTDWSVDKGAPPDVWALTQTPDGYLMLGTGGGLYRYDGVRLDKVVPFGDRTESSNITSLYVDRAGALWIGYFDGEVAILRGNRLTNVSRGMPNAQEVWQIAQDPKGRMWAVVMGRHGGLLQFERDRWRIEKSIPRGFAFSVLFAREGTAWVCDGQRLFVRRARATRFETTLQAVPYFTALAESRDGRIWISQTGNGPRPLPDILHGAPPVHITGTKPFQRMDAERIWFDRDGALWGSSPNGIVRIRKPSTVTAEGTLPIDSIETFGLEDGLSSNIVSSVFEDSEGDIWFGTNLGVDRFRPANVVLAAEIDVTSRTGYRMAAARDGAVYVATDDALFRAKPGQMMEQLTPLHHDLLFLGVDSDEKVVPGSEHGALPVNWPGAAKLSPPWPSSAETQWSEDGKGQFWVAVRDTGVFAGSGEVWRKVMSRDEMACSLPSEVAADRSGAIWTVCNGLVRRWHSGQSETYDSRAGLSVGHVEIIALGRFDTFVSGDFGLARFNGSKFETLSSRDESALSRVSGIVQTVSGDTWLSGINGLSRIRTIDLRRAFEHPGSRLPVETFDHNDGLPGGAQQDERRSTMVEAGDGRLWLATGHGVAWIDPNHLVRNRLPPPVLVRSIVASGESKAPEPGLSLPAGAPDVEFDYTALSFSIPERVRFKYRLEGFDPAWIDAGQRREAFYTNLRPGAYKFDVTASNGDGFWNKRGATLSFVIPPTFVQSGWFVLLCAIAASVLLWLIYLFRIQQLKAEFARHLEAQTSERERIARELHDTLLQGFLGLLLQFHAAAKATSPGSRARTMLEETLRRAQEVIKNSRERILDIRTRDARDNLAHHLTVTAENLQQFPGPRIRVVSEDEGRLLDFDACDNLAKIADEALFNAYHHANASVITVTIASGDRQFRLVMEDDGKGIDSHALERAGREGHFGLKGMLERAASIGAHLVISSRPGGGTMVSVTLAADAAYAGPSTRRWFGSIREIVRKALK